jgi:diacylglycerol kinase
MRQFLNGRAKSFTYAFEGINYVFKTQKNAQIHLIIIAVVILAACWLQLPGSDFAVIVLTIGLVLGAEFFNTAIETLVDLVSPGQHPLAKITKDVCAGGVLISAICAVFVGMFLFIPPIINKLAFVFK